MALFTESAKEQVKETVAPSETKKEGKATDGVITFDADKNIVFHVPANLKDAVGAKKRAASDYVMKYIADNKDKFPKEVIACGGYYAPTIFGVTPTRVGGNFQKKDISVSLERLMKLVKVEKKEDIKAGATFDELHAFKTLKFGQSDMRSLAKKLQNDGWTLDFDADKGVYTVKAFVAPKEAKAE